MKHNARETLATYHALVDWLQKQPEHKQALSLLLKFVRGLVHDFNTPLSVFSLDLFSLARLTARSRKASTSEIKADLARITRLERNLSKAAEASKLIVDDLDRVSEKLRFRS